MGFYGNITNVNKTSLTFDKIYANRYEMDQAVQSPEGDGIYVGRFVLVDYNKGVPANNYARVYHLGYSGHNNNFYFEDNNDDTYRARYSSEPYWIEETIEKEDGTPELIKKINPKRDDTELKFHLFIGQIVYTFNESSKVYKFYITKEATNSKWAILEEIETPVDAEPYFENFIIDRREYGDSIGRGYDSTVWQKVYYDDTEKYVMLAELNSIVPTFDVTVDAPTINPVKPHFDADTTNIYYKLHVQPSWGLRVKELTEDDGYLSDQTASSDEIIWDPILKKRVSRGKSKYDAAIYYNKKGFDSEKRYEREQPKELITIKDTGSSGQIYNIHDYRLSGVTKTDTANDIQELVIQLPSIGNAISDLWNIIYGYGDLVEDANGVKTYRRNKNIAWDSVAGDRLVTENPDGSGFNYNPEKVETVAGCINSIHDLMGMIITDEQKDTDNALMNRIYYGDYREDLTAEEPYKGYYIKELSYKINPDKIITKEDIEALKVQDILEFSKNKYYYINNSNYYLETNKYDSGNKYYELEENDIVPVSFYDKDYEPNKFYYKDNGNFKLSATTYAVPGIEYYYTESEIKAKNIIDNSKDIRFFPTNKIYFDKYFSSTPFEELRDVEGSEGTLKRGDGWFYLDEAENLYKPFTYVEDRQYIQYLRYVTNFLVEQSIDVQTGETRWVYDLEKGANQTVYTTFEFEPNKYYYYQPNEENEELPGSYILLTSEEEIDLKKIYISFPEDKDQFKLIEEQFYIPDTYYYKEGNDYLFGVEDKRRMDKYYFLIDSASEVQGTFYEPYKYYYVLHGEYVLDTNDKPTPGREYYREGVHYYVLEDPRGILKPYSKLNAALVSNLPDGVKIGPREEIYKWRELEGFSRTLNSIHGMLLELNRIIRFEDKVTRDERTLAGTLNKINDVLTTIGKLTPGQIVVTDSYGRMTSADSDTTQIVESTEIEYDYTNNNFISTTSMLNENGSWVGFDITLNEEEITTDIAFGHKYNPINPKSLLNLDILETDMNEKGDTFGVVKPVIDNMGHIVQVDAEKITLPNSYKSIITGDTSAVAQNSKDEIKIDTDQWLAAKAENDENGKSLMTFTHEYPTKKDDTTSEIDINESVDTIILETVSVDEKGHIINKNQNTVTLPSGFKFVEAEEGKATAQNGKDTLKVQTLDNWLKSVAITDANGISTLTITHEPTEEVADEEAELDLNNNGDILTLETINIDDRGHVINKKQTKVTLPFGYKSIKADTGELIAENTQDTFSILTEDEWLTTNVVNGAIKITHNNPISGEIVADTKVDLQNGTSFNIIDYHFDNKGHIYGTSSHTYTLDLSSIENAIEELQTQIDLDNDGVLELKTDVMELINSSESIINKTISGLIERIEGLEERVKELEDIHKEAEEPAPDPETPEETPIE